MSVDKHNDFYPLLARLFYALASSDGVVREEEFHKLIEIVDTEWLETGSKPTFFGSDAAHQITICFELLLHERAMAEDVFIDIKQYKQANPEIFTEHIKTKIIRSAIKLAHAVNATNKSELVFLSQLESALH